MEQGEGPRSPRRVILGGAALVGALGAGLGVGAWHRGTAGPGEGAAGAGVPGAVSGPEDVPSVGRETGPGSPSSGALEAGALEDPSRGPEGAGPSADGPLAALGLTVDAPTAATLERFVEDLDHVAELGMGWVRFAALAHEVVQDWGEGSGSLTMHDEGLEMLSAAVGAARERGLAVCLMSVDVWDGHTRSGRRASTDEVLAAMRDYWSHLAAAVADRVSIWQIFNEADAQHYRTHEPVDPLTDRAYLQELAASLASARTVLREVEPASRLTTNLFGYPIDAEIDTRWRSSLQRLAPSLDVITLDAYPQLDPEAIELTGNLVRALAEDLAPSPVMIGEIGLQTCSGCFTEQEQADACAAYLRMLPATGAQAAFLYELRDREGGDPEDSFGILRADGSPKPAYEVLAGAGG